ncbi:hypothetical protein PQR01_39455 [Paraburkholderia rhynchosiae]|uniref:Uncharacterized protein n=2 Tax=Paraburkholderia TaxID=1822464 RepID=A0ACC7NNZ1_9BURK
MRADRRHFGYPELRDRLMELLRHHSGAEFLNRVDEVVLFGALGKEQIRRIVDLRLARVQTTAAARNIDLSIDDSLRDHLADICYDPEFGAPMLKRKIPQEGESQPADAVLRGDVREGDKVVMTYDRAQTPCS